MLNLTRQEKTVLLFIAWAVFTGISINYLLKHNSRFKEYYRFASIQPIPASKINLNHANLNDLISLPGIGPELARRIIDYRSSEGVFTSAEDIKKVKGFGDRKFELLKDKISVENNSQ